jgi:hypothetical protein
MAELVVAGLLGVTGYLISNSASKTAVKENIAELREKGRISKGEMPSVDHVYSSQHYNKTVEDEIRRANKQFAEAREPVRANSGYLADGGVVSELGTTIYSRLAGVEMDKDEFKHANMVPFFGGKVTQNMDIDKTESRDILARYTGVGREAYWEHKKEVENFSDAMVYKQDVTGSANNLEYFKNVYENNVSKFHNNFLPFEQVRVGPGISKGESTPDGGVQQAAFRDIELERARRDMNDRRVINKPRETYEGRTVDGQKGNLPGDIGAVCKNRVETHFEQKPDMYLQAGNQANAKEMNRPCHDMKPQHRATTGRTQSVHITNLSRLVSSLTTPLEDIMRPNRKEYTILNGRPMGNFQNTNPPKHAIHDPSDVLRTTIKEMNIHNTTLANIRGETADYVEPFDYARTTMRETTEDAMTLGNMQNNMQMGADGYKTATVTMKDTDRQYLDGEYIGPSMNATPHHMSQEDAQNAVINEVKELLLKERRPTKISVNVPMGADCMQVENKVKIESDDVYHRKTGNYSRPLVEQTPAKTAISLTRPKFEYRELDRINPEILDGFNKNPYTHSLQSATFR